MEVDCLTCEHRPECEKAYGRIGVDEENCTAVAGSHFCLASWQPHIDHCKKSHEKPEKTMNSTFFLRCHNCGREIDLKDFKYEKDGIHITVDMEERIFISCECGNKWFEING